ncbi:MAG: DUF1778 domain-containing protein [Candidatus Thiodiazotropha weberae]|nr:DUF1778 domain-containing protein [Candidatus Thiodiazotropha weberae]
MSSDTPRMVTRIDEETRKTLTEAASIAGLPSLNAFVVSAAMEKALKIIERNRVIKLTEKGCEQLVSILENPPEPNEKLKSAFRHYQDRID